MSQEEKEVVNLLDMSYVLIDKDKRVRWTNLIKRQEGSYDIFRICLSLIEKLNEGTSPKDANESHIKEFDLDLFTLSTIATMVAYYNASNIEYKNYCIEEGILRVKMR